MIFSKAETNKLNEAARILDEARRAVGEDSDLGTELGKGEMILRCYSEGALIDSKTTSDIGDLII